MNVHVGINNIDVQVNNLNDEFQQGKTSNNLVRQYFQIFYFIKCRKKEKKVSPPGHKEFHDKSLRINRVHLVHMNFNMGTGNACKSTSLV
jgi:hypothetical protein